MRIVVVISLNICVFGRKVAYSDFNIRTVCPLDQIRIISRNNKLIRITHAVITQTQCVHWNVSRVCLSCWNIQSWNLTWIGRHICIVCWRWTCLQRHWYLKKRNVIRYTSCYVKQKSESCKYSRNRFCHLMKFTKSKSWKRECEREWEILSWENWSHTLISYFIQKFVENLIVC